MQALSFDPDHSQPFPPSPVPQETLPTILTMPPPPPPAMFTQKRVRYLQIHQSDRVLTACMCCTGFTKPIWRNGVLLTLALALAYRVAPSDSLSTDSAEENPITAYIAHHSPSPSLWKERADKHLQLAKIAADDKLLFQEAERPKVRRLRYLG